MTSTKAKQILGEVISDSLTKIGFDQVSNDQQKLAKELADKIYKRFASRIDQIDVANAIRK